jgi:hypothetical protein
MARRLSRIVDRMMTGRCLCGAVAFAAEHVETEHHVCHCGMCRRWCGAPFLGAHVKGLAFTAGADQVGRYVSSDWAERGFCKGCGTSLFYYAKPADAYIVCVGAFDDQTPFRVVREIFIDKKPSGYDFAGDHERWTEAETFAHFQGT